MTIRIDGTNTTANPGITGADADTGLQFGTNELKLVTGGTEAVKIDSNQKLTASQGILFGTDTAAANTLDDYEEGTWTPRFEGADTAGSYSYDSNVGRYTKVGNLVTVFCELTNINTNTAGSGAINIIGLPFFAGNIGFSVYGTAYTDRFSSLDVQIFARVDHSSNKIRIRKVRDGNTDVAVNVTDKDGNLSDIGCTIQYLVS